MHYTGTPPQHQRIHFKDASDNIALRMAIYMGSVFQRLDVYADGVYVQPENAEKQGSQLIYKPGDYQPDISTENNGANWVDMDMDTIHIIVRGGSVIDIKLQPVIVLGFNVPSVSVDEFFEDNLVQNLANLLGIDKEDIVIMDAVSEASRRRRDAMTYCTVQIGYTEQHSPNNNMEDYDSINSMCHKLKECIQTGEFHRILGILAEDITVMDPLLEPDHEDYLEMTWEIGNNTWMADDTKTVETVAMHEKPKPLHEGTAFQIQPKIKFKDENVSMYLDHWANHGGSFGRVGYFPYSVGGVYNTGTCTVI